LSGEMTMMTCPRYFDGPSEKAASESSFRVASSVSSAFDEPNAAPAHKELLIVRNTTETQVPGSAEEAGALESRLTHGVRYFVARSVVVSWLPLAGLAVLATTFSARNILCGRGRRRRGGFSRAGRRCGRGRRCERARGDRRWRTGGAARWRCSRMTAPDPRP